MSAPRAACSLLLTLALLTGARGDQPPHFAPFDVQRGEYLAEVRPAGGGAAPDGDRGWEVIVYRLRAGERVRLWSAPTEHTGYAFEHRLAADGRTFTTVREWLTPDRPLVRLVREGEVLAELDLADLQVPPAALGPTLSHRTWLTRKGNAAQLADEGGREVLRLRLGDGSVRTIDLVSGRIGGLPDEDEWVLAASYMNPGMDEAGCRAHDALTAALGAAGVQSAAAGSVGFSLSVPAPDGPRARAIVARLIAREGLEASVTR